MKINLLDKLKTKRGLSALLALVLILNLLIVAIPVGSIGQEVNALETPEKTLTVYEQNQQKYLADYEALKAESLSKSRSEKEKPDVEELPGYQEALNQLISDKQASFVKVTEPVENTADIPSVNENIGNASFKQAVTLPSSFDLRNVNGNCYISQEVKNQGHFGTCWTFAAIGSIESSLIKAGYASYDNIDLSEKHLAYYNYYTPADKLGNTAPDSVTANQEYADDGCYLNFGGNDPEAAFTLASRFGAVAEAAAENNGIVYEPYGDPYAEALQSEFTPELGYSLNSYHLRNSRFVSTEDTSKIKEMLMQYGAASMGYFHDDYYYNALTGAYYNYDATYSNHAVLLVGWDDNYSKTNFESSTPPSKNGAWLARNSWGPYWGNSGFFWISYEDVSFLTNNVVCFYECEPISSDNNIYQYDGSQYTSYLNINENGDSVWGANVFTAKQNESIDSVMIYTDDTNVHYDAYVYTSLTDANDPDSGTLAASKSGTLETYGYNTVKLDSPVSISYGQKFSVVVRYSMLDGSEFYSFPVEGSVNYIDYDDNPIMQYSAGIDAGQSFLGFGVNTPANWSDLARTSYSGNLRIKATTVSGTPVPAQSISLSEGSVEVERGGSVTIIATVSPSNHTDLITWETSDASIATVSDGIVTGKSAGTCIISATVNGMTAMCSVTVTLFESDMTFYAKNGQEVTVNLVLCEEMPVQYDFGGGVMNAACEELAITEDDNTPRVLAEYNDFGYYYATITGTVTNGKLKIFSEPDNVLAIGCPESGLDDIDIAKCSFLETLDCSYNNLSNLTFNTDCLGMGVSYLSYLYCGNNYLTAIDTSKLLYLFDLEAECNNLTSLNFGRCPSLKVLVCYDNKLVSLNVSACKYLGYLDCDYNELTSLSLTSNTYLYVLCCSDNKLKSLKVTANKELYALTCAFNELSSLNLSYNKELMVLDCAGNKLSALDITNNKQLFALDCRGNKLTFQSLPIFYPPEDGEYLYGYQMDVPMPGEILHETEFGAFSELLYGKSVNLNKYASRNGSYTTYTWCTYDENYDLISFAPASSTNNVFTFGEAQKGQYICCLMTNPLFPDLELYTSFAYLSLRSTSLSLPKSAILLTEGSTYDLLPSLLPVGNTDGVFTVYYVYNQDGFDDSVAEIDEYETDKFRIIAKSTGHVTLTVEAYNVLLDKTMYTAVFEVNVTEAPEISAAPVIPTVATDYASITVNWTPIDGVSGYELYRAGSNNAYDLIATISNENAKSYVDNKLPFNTTYTYMLRAFDDSGDTVKYTEYSNEMSATTVPDAPELTVSQSASTTLKLSWTAVPGASGYFIYRSLGDETEYSLRKTITKGTTVAFSDTSLVSGTKYNYLIVAYRNSGGRKITGAFSETVSNTPVPAAPAKPSLTYSNGYPKIAWKAVSGATGYYVLRSGSLNGDYATIGTVTNLKALNFTDSAVSYNDTYYYKVQAFRTLNGVTTDGLISAAISASPELAAPTVRAVSSAYNKVTISWDKVDRATGYYVYRSTQEGQLGTLLKTITKGTTLSVADTSVVTGNTYYYTVCAYNKAKVSGSHSLQVSAIPVLAKPAQPTVSQSSYYLKIAWKAVSGSTGYNVYRSVNGSDYALIKTTTSKIRTFNDTDVVKGVTYSYTVQPIRNDYLGTISASRSGVPTLAAPKSVKASRAGYDSIKISFKKASGATTYVIYRSNSKTGVYYRCGSVNSNDFTTTTVSYVDYGLDTAKTYYYLVRSQRSLSGVTSSSANSSIVSAKTSFSSISGLSAKAAGVDSIWLSWNELDGADFYEIYRSTKTASSSFTHVGTAYWNEFVDTGLTAGKTYYYKVKAGRYQSNGISYSKITAYKSAKPALLAPTGFTVTPGSFGFDLEWDDNNEATSYQIYRSTKKTSGFKLLASVQYDTSYTDSTTTSGKTYYYKVRSVGSQNGKQLTSGYTVVLGGKMP